MSKGLFGLIAAMFGLFILDMVAIVEAVAWLAIVLSGPIVFVIYMIHVQKSGTTDFQPFSKVQRLKFYGTLFTMIMSVGAITVYVFNNPQLIWS